MQHTGAFQFIDDGDLILRGDVQAIERIQQVHDVETHVIPNFLNREQLTYSATLLNDKQSNDYVRDATITIGYFSGTPSHNKDFRIIVEALTELLNQDERVRLWLVGFLDLPDSLKPYKTRITRHPLQDFINLQRLCAKTEINIVPLQDNRFTNSKSELKFF